MSSGQSVNVLLKHNVVTGATMAFSARLIPDILPIPKNWVHDAWIALLIAEIADLKYIPEPLVLYRQHSNNQIGGVRKTLLEEIETTKNTKRKSYLEAAEQYSVAKEHFKNSTMKKSKQSNIEFLLEKKIRHLQNRSDMPSSLIKRLPIVMIELLGFRYHRYSGGFKSFLKDIAGL